MRPPSDIPPRRRRDPVAGLLLGLSIPLLAAGLAIPALSLTSLMLFETTYSLAGLVFTLLEQGKVALFVIVLLFSIAVPAAKTLIAAVAWFYAGDGRPGLQRLLHALSALSKWSMLDVFVVALTIIVLEGTLLSSTDVHPGIVLFAASVLLSSLAVQRLARRDGSR